MTQGERKKRGWSGREISEGEGREGERKREQEEIRKFSPLIKIFGAEGASWRKKRG